MACLLNVGVQQDPSLDDLLNIRRQLEAAIERDFGFVPRAGSSLTQVDPLIVRQWFEVMNRAVIRQLGALTRDPYVLYGPTRGTGRRHLLDRIAEEIAGEVTREGVDPPPDIVLHVAVSASRPLLTSYTHELARVKGVAGREELAIRYMRGVSRRPIAHATNVLFDTLYLLEDLDLRIAELKGPSTFHHGAERVRHASGESGDVSCSQHPPYDVPAARTHRGDNAVGVAASAATLSLVLSPLECGSVPAA